MSDAQGTRSDVVMYSSPFCGYCSAAKRLLRAKGVAFTEIDVLFDSTKRQEMIERSQCRTVPQIFVGAKHVGGFVDLSALDASGELDELLAAGRRSQQ